MAYRSRAHRHPAHPPPPRAPHPGREKRERKFGMATKARFFCFSGATSFGHKAHDGDTARTLAVGDTARTFIVDAAAGVEPCADHPHYATSASREQQDRAGASLLVSAAPHAFLFPVRLHIRASCRLSRRFRASSGGRMMPLLSHAGLTRSLPRRRRSSGQPTSRRRGRAAQRPTLCLRRSARASPR